MIPRRALLRTLVAIGCSFALTIPASAASFTSDRISVKTSGSGKDVILIPGLSSSPRVWTEMMQAVPGYRYHLVQVAGFAGVPKGGNAEGVIAAPVAAEIARYIKDEKLNKPALIGHSMGGTMGLMIAARHPDAVSKLMVVDMLPFLGKLFGPQMTTESVKPIAASLQAQVSNPDPAQRKLRVEAAIASMVNTQAMRQAAVDDGLGSDIDVSARAYHELFVTDLMPELPKIAVPTTVLYVNPKAMGKTDAQIGELYQGSYAGLKQGKVKFFPDSAHFIMWDQPARFAAEVKAFLE